jgi:serine/threonine protein kinase/WD40 repeat protein
MTDIEAHPTVNRLSAYVQGQLDVPEMDEIEQHLSSCDSCCHWIRDQPEDSLVAKLRGRNAATASAPLTDEEPAVEPPSDFQIPSSFVLGPGVKPALHERTTVAGPPADPPAPAGLPVELNDHPRYRIVAALGTGGMGTVYRAEHRLMDRPVALKVIRGDLLGNEALVERFRREVKSAARLVSHPNIVVAYDAEQAGGTHMLVMEFIEGTDLARLVDRRGPLPVGEACEYVRQAALGLQHAFEDGMVHRDIKPQNLMRTTRGQIKILDFGLARFASEVASLGGVTAEGMVLGSADYIAPEQIDDPHSADIRADIYSLGCTLYYLLAGHPPFPSGNLIQKLRAHGEEAPRPLVALRADVPPDVAAIVGRMMAKDPSRRFRTPDEVAQALVPFADAPSAATNLDAPARAGAHTLPAPWPSSDSAVGNQKPSGQPTRSDARPRRPWVWIAAALALLPIVAVSLALILYLLMSIRTPRGELIIESDDPDIEVIVKQGGQQVTIVDPKTSNRIELNAGRYELQLASGGAGLRLSTDTFTLKRGDKTVVSVRRLLPEPSARPGPYVLADAESADLGEIRRSDFQSPHDLLNNAFLLPDNRHVLYSTGGDFQGGQWLPGTDPALWLGDFTSMTKLPRKYTGHDPGAISLALSRDGRRAVSASEDKTLRLWDLETGQSRLIRREDGALGAVALSPDDRHAAYVCDTTIYLCDLETGDELMTFRGHELGIARIAFCGDGRRIVSCGSDKTIRVWDVETGKELRRLAHGEGVSDLAIFPDGRRVLATSGDASIVWNLETGRQVRRISRTASSVAVSPDGRRALFGKDTAVWLWDLERDEKLEQLQAYIPEYRFKELVRDLEIEQLRGHTQPVWRVAFSPDGRRGVSTSFDRTVRIWALPPGRPPGEAPVQAPQPEPSANAKGKPRPADAISPRTRAILATLDEPVPMNFAGETTLDDLLKYIQQATWKGKKPTDPGLPIYVDPLGLKEAGQTPASTVRMNVIGSPLKVTLPLLLGELGLAYVVKDDVLIISSSRGIDRERNETANPAVDASPETRAVLAKLDAPITMPFAGGSTLHDVLDYIKQATAAPGSDDISIFVDPVGLRDTGRSMDSTMSMYLEGVPLKSSLRLILKQIGLAYTVKDGVVIIGSAEGIRKQTVRLPAPSPDKADQPAAPARPAAAGP